MTQKPPVIAHIIYRLSVGGLENGLVNLINRIPPDRYSHVIICLKEATDFSQRIQRPDVQIMALHRKEGQDFGMFMRLFSVLRALKPDIVHTRNIATLECQVPAWLAGVRARVHGEHGWDVADPGGTNKKYQWLRRLLRPWVQYWIPLSKHSEVYLRAKVGVPATKIRRICNGVNTEAFYPRADIKPSIAGCPFGTVENLVLFGTVGRMHGVKDQMTLVRAFIHLLHNRPEFAATARLVLVGDGPLRQEAITALTAAGLADLAWLPGERNDVSAILRGLDIFVLPSLAEGISNGILEAMATGLAVVATDVGGNPDLVLDGVTGRLLPAANPVAMAAIFAEYLEQPDRIRAHGAAGLERVLQQFSLDSMVSQYLAVYDDIHPLRQGLCAG